MPADLALRAGALLLLCAAAGTCSCSDARTTPTPDPRQAEWQQLDDAGRRTYALGDYESAQRAWEEALALARTAPLDSSRLAESLGNAARVAAIVGRPWRADSLLVELRGVLEARRPGSQEAAEVLLHLAEISVELDQPDRAVGLLSDRLELLRQLDPRHPQIPATMGSLAQVLARQGRVAAADSLSSRAMGQTLRQQGYAYMLQRRDVDAESYLRRALDLQQRRLGAGDVDVAFTCMDLARLSDATGALDKAEQFYRQALQVYVGAGNPSAATARQQLAELLHRQGRHAAADSVIAGL